MKQLSIRTNSRSEMIDITRAVESVVEEANVRNGICYVFVPHTTAAVTINENADPDVPRDIIMELEKVIPYQDNYRHREGNSAAHIKASLIGSSETVLVEGGRLLLGTWQSLFFCEFDGPRTRKYVVKIVATGSETENRNS
jgi:secondary thiamine-phosphate synthase enzyme